MDGRKLLEIKDLSKTFKISRGKYLHAVDRVSLSIEEGETVGLIGESGCGKSTLGRTIVKLYPESGGSIIFDGKELARTLGRNERHAYSRQVQMIFQDPYSALDPRMTVKDIVAEGPDAHGMWPRDQRGANVDRWLQRVGLHPSHASRYPHEFSGGQRQRIAIARALALEPRLVICDEPLSALDVSVQAQIVKLLKDLQREHGLTYLFIAHDLSMIRVICDRMAVMYLGSIVEIGSTDEVYENPQHPYTQAPISATPIPDPVRERKRQRKLIEGEVTSLINPVPGCKFAPRCPLVIDLCRRETPELLRVGSGQRRAACHLVARD